MKIRIKGNSIRYRLTKTEVDNFGKLGFLEEKTEFLNGASFYYRLEKKAGITNMEASFSGNRISIFVPENMTAKMDNHRAGRFRYENEDWRWKGVIFADRKRFCLP